MPPPGYDDALAGAVKYIRAKRGGDLVGIILVGSGARRTVTAHSDIDLIVLVKGPADGQEMIRVETAWSIFDMVSTRRWARISPIPPSGAVTPEGRILYDHEDIAAQLIAKAAQRFRQGPPAARIHERIRLKGGNVCIGWAGRGPTRPTQHGAISPATVLRRVRVGVFRIRGLWFTAPVDTLRFLASRDPALGELASQFLSAATLHDQLTAGRRFADTLFREIPLPPRVDQ